MPRSSELAERVQQTQEARASGVQKTMDQWIEHYADEFATVLPEVMDRERFVRLSLNVLRWKPELRECDPFSFIGAMMTCAQIGLDPSGPFDHVYLTPRNVNVAPRNQPKQWVKRVQMTIGYEGYRELAGRTGAVKKILAEVVYENDDFNLWLEDGEQRIYHKPKVFTDRGEPIGAFAVAHMIDGSVIARAVDLVEIEKAKQSSPSGSKDEGPWVDWWEAMAAKTAIRRLWKQLPKTPQSAVGYTLDTATVAQPPDGSLLEAPPKLMLDMVGDSVSSDEAEEPEAEETEGPAGDAPEGEEPSE